MNRQRYREEYLQEWPVARILAAAGSSDAPRYSLRKFGRYARDADVKLIFAHLKTETDVETCRRLLWSLSDATLSEMDVRIWELANDGASGLRSEATVVLSSLWDPRVAELGRQRLRDGDFSAADDDLITLFILNFKPGDEAPLLSKLESLALDDDTAHAFGKWVNRLSYKQDLPELAEWVYRTNPCTICRNSAFESLEDMDKLPAQIACEYQHDAQRHTRKPSN